MLCYYVQKQRMKELAEELHTLEAEIDILSKEITAIEVEEAGAREED